MSEIIKNRSEIVFLYDVRDGNPNGDPADGNKPRIDETSGINIVTDVRLKRTIRDYINKVKGHEIFVKKIEDLEGIIQTSKQRAQDFQNDPDKILSECVDVRMFGGTIPIKISDKKDGSITFTGPVQFSMGRSLHRVELKHVKGTGAFASSEGKKQQTFREEWILPYSLISFYGVINENGAEDTQLTEEDVKLLVESIWNGTNDLLTRSKMVHRSRVLLQIIYQEKNFHVGELDKKIKMKAKVEDEKIRGTDDYTLEFDNFVEAIKNNKEKVKIIRYKVDDSINLEFNGDKKTIEEILKLTECELEELKF
ncbi:MAG: type I-B CRISPR-associated protein Cas7/Csh2 [Candidatus Heimdallarchaeum aukensis]|uniref:Type I-B CRISPR-associated protein Cas7/Csh2 n=1 Tax=Candidatus Heimdallarchaeum aukensis TaxID=2876573 RepID=A0A9Y1FLQ1_9ARCH|nr:MAG: type I-B CRISPR-associated protein Cas7/Csh2 [Candidatus Heimdallarchaeum aukensis]